MTTPRSGPSRADGNLLAVLSERDVFAELRTDEEVARMVTSLATKTSRPYAALLTLLVGTPTDLEEETAHALWLDAVTHRRRLVVQLGRPVHLRVAALDLLMTQKRLGGRRRPVLVAAGMVQDAIEALAVDPLTGLLRREHFRLLAEHELRRRAKVPPILAYIDLDDFKQINDQLGHATGDAVLRAVGEAWRAHARRGDLMARLGGDEFGVLFTGCSEDNAQAALRRVERAAQRAVPEAKVAFSFGLTAAAADDALDELLARADDAMYAHKRERRTAQPAPKPKRAAEPAPQLAICVSTRPELLLEVHLGLAAWGVMVIPSVVASARLLTRLLRPQVVFADVLVPPRGGAQVVADVRASQPDVKTCVLVPPRWKSRSGKRLGHGILIWPPEIGPFARFQKSTFGTARAPVATLESAAQVETLQRAIQRLLAGKALDAATTELLGPRPELDLIRQAMGS